MLLCTKPSALSVLPLALFSSSSISLYCSAQASFLLPVLSHASPVPPPWGLHPGCPRLRTAPLPTGVTMGRGVIGSTGEKSGCLEVSPCEGAKGEGGGDAPGCGDKDSTQYKEMAGKGVGSWAWGHCSWKAAC